jgi:hypothetical protein
MNDWLSGLLRANLGPTTVRRIVATLVAVATLWLLRWTILLTIRYLCEPRRRRVAASAIWEDILDAFATHPEMDFAYPTTRYFDHRTEGRRRAEGTPSPPA